MDDFLSRIIEKSWFEVDFMDISSLFIVIEEEFNIDIGLRIEADGYDDDEKFIEEKIPTVLP